MLMIRVSMRPIFYRHYRPSHPFKFPTTSSPHPNSKPHLLSLISQPASLYHQSDMAQRTENEETEFKVPETLTLCVNNCGVTGNPATNNMCQNCFNATTAPSSSASPSMSPQIPHKFCMGENTPRSTTASRSPRRSDGSRAVKLLPDPQSTVAMARREVNRCSGCRRKVGLTGFRCRCGDLFCSDHRYSDRHVCSYDYKTVGREAIARENPVVKAAKIIKV